MDFDDMVARVNLARIAELEGKVTKARLDYEAGTPTVTDAVYDAWRDELKDLKADSPAVTAIGAPPVTEWRKVAHGVPMGSLDKVNTPEEMTAWVGGLHLGFEPLFTTEKLDGASIHLRFENGDFVQAMTRGDGTLGEDITVNVRRMKGVPGHIPGGVTGSIRGEIVVTKSDFAAHFPDKVSTRNTAAGTSKRYDGVGCEHLTVKVYWVAEGADFTSMGEMFTWLSSVGFQVPNWRLCATPEDVVAVWHDYQAGKRDALDYEIDGLVISINDLARQISLGEKDGRPCGAVAFKFEAAARETTLRKIEWQVGGTGRLTPVAVFDPVPLVGAVVTQASLYNAKYIRDLGLVVGCRILVSRANDVIPRVTEVVEGASSAVWLPCTCPVCGFDVVPEGEYLVCTNTADCPAQKAGRIERYIAAIGVQEWGEVLVENLVESGLVQTPADLYRLTSDTMSEIDRVTKHGAETFIALLWEKDELPLEKLLGALSIPLCAESTIRTVMLAGYDTLDAMRSASSEALQKVAGVGPARGKALSNWFQSHGKIVDDLLSVGVKVKAVVKGALTGMTFCFTGAMTHARPDLEAMVVAAGGVVKSSVTKGLTYLVMADPNSNSTKAQAARKNGTKCISEAEFLTMAGAPPEG